VEAGNLSEVQDELAFVAQRTTFPLEELGETLPEVQKESENLNLTFDQLLPLVVALNEEFGSQQAINQELNQTIGDAEGSYRKFVEELGFTREEIEGYRQEIEAASGLAERNAAINEEAASPLQRFAEGFKQARFQLVEGFQDFEAVNDRVDSFVDSMVSAAEATGEILRDADSLAGAFERLSAKVGLLPSGFGEVGAAAPPALGEAAGASQEFEETLSTVIGNLGDVVGPALRDALEELEPIVEDYAPILGDAAVTLVDAIVEGISGEQQALTDVVTDDVLPLIVDVLTSSEVKSAVAGAASEIALSIGEGLIDTLQRGGGPLGTAASVVETILTGQLSGQLATFRDIGSDIASTIGDAVVDSIPDSGVSAVIDQIVSTIMGGLSTNSFAALRVVGADIAGEVAGAISDLPGDLFSVGSDAVDSLVDGLGSAFDRLAGVAGNIRDTITSRLDPAGWFSTPEEHYRELFGAAFAAIGDEARQRAPDLTDLNVGQLAPQSPRDAADLGVGGEAAGAGGQRVVDQSVNIEQLQATDWQNARQQLERQRRLAALKGRGRDG